MARVLAVGRRARSCVFSALALSAVAWAALVPPATAAGWSSAGSMTTPRVSPTAMLLPSGKVLVMGGNTGPLESADLYDPVTNSWSSAGTLGTPDLGGTVTLLRTGKVLVAGGEQGFNSVASAELYDPETESWSSAASMATPRDGATATLLRSGKVLVAGGESLGPGLCHCFLGSAELYDPATNTWSPAAGMPNARLWHTATLLPSGKVLVAGGVTNWFVDIASGELYDPTTNIWSSAGPMAYDQIWSTATLLANGKVLFAGGAGMISQYPPPPGPCDHTSTDESSAGSTALRRNTARFLSSGATPAARRSIARRELAAAELYDPATNGWSPAGCMSTVRYGATATLLPSGKVLVAGGDGKGSAEVYDPAANSWSTAGTMATPRAEAAATLLPNGKVLVVGGVASPNVPASAELYQPPVASVPSRVATVGAKLKFTLTCDGATGESCQGQVTATAIEKLSSNGQAITGVLSSNPRSARYRSVTILTGNFKAATGQRLNVSIGLNPAGRMLRHRFKNFASDVDVTAIDGLITSTIRTAEVTFRPDPPKASLTAAAIARRARVSFKIRCQGTRGHICRGTGKLTAYERLASDGHTIIGFSRTPSPTTQVVVLRSFAWSLKAGSARSYDIQINATGRALLAKFRKIPATLQITPTYNGYTLTTCTVKVTMRR